MKYLLQPLAIMSGLFLVNCSSIPEIQPYQEKKELTIEDVREASGFYKDTEFDEPTTPIADSEDAASEKADKMAVTEEPFDEPAQPDPEPIAEPVMKKEVVKKVAVVEKVREPKSPKTARHQASSFKNGMHVFAQNCAMKSKPDSGSADAGQVQAGKKLWLDSHNGQWLKAYKKSGTVYIPVDCVK